MTDTGTFSCLGFQEKTEEPRVYNKVQVDLKSRFGGCSVKLNMWSTEQLCSPLPTAPPPQVPSGLEMADDFGGGDVDLLIGIDNMYRIVLWEQLELSEGLRAIETNLRVRPTRTTWRRTRRSSSASALPQPPSRVHVGLGHGWDWCPRDG